MMCCISSNLTCLSCVSCKEWCVTIAPSIVFMLLGPNERGEIMNSYGTNNMGTDKVILCLMGLL